MNTNSEPVIQAIRQHLNDAVLVTDAVTGYTCYTGYNRPKGEKQEYKILYDWDCYFEAIAISYAREDWAQLAQNAVRFYLTRQRDDGFIPRSVHFKVDPVGKEIPGIYWWTLAQYEHFKPFLGQLVLLISQKTGDFTWVTGEIFFKIVRHLNYWQSQMDKDADGLAEWSSAPGSGMDTQIDRVGDWESYKCVGVDLNCYIYRDLKALAHVATRLGKTTSAKELEERAGVLREKIQSLWHADDGMFYDHNRYTGQPIRIKSINMFMPLWARIATPEQAKIMVERYLGNPKEFWTPYPVATYAQTEPGYSSQPKPDAPSACSCTGGVWMELNYVAFHCLLNYGYTALAKALAEKSHALVVGNPRLHEFYDQNTGQGRGMTPFYGWTALGAFMLHELEHHLDPTNVEIA